MDLQLQLLQDSELIEAAIIQRLKVNGAILQYGRDKNGGVGKSIGWSKKNKLSKAQTLLMQHELRMLLDKYEANQQTLFNLSRNHPALVEEKTLLTTSNIVQLAQETIENGENLAIQQLTADDSQISAAAVIENDTNDIYQMFSSNNNYKNLKKSDECRLQSLFTSKLHLSNFFNAVEHYGDFLDLHDSYNLWLSLARDKIHKQEQLPTYSDYLRNILHRDESLDVDHAQYLHYLIQLEHYLSTFKFNVDPLDQLSHDAALEPHVDLDAPAADSLFCLVCNKRFSKQGSFQHHIPSKRHSKRGQSSEVQRVISLELKIKNWLTHSPLVNILADTIVEVERFSLLSNREKELELEDKQKQRLKSPSISSTAILSGQRWSGNGSDGNDDGDGDGYGDGDGDNSKHSKENSIEENPLNLPLGPDGKPIPFWLYKLKGLRYDFNCQICGNKYYKGRLNFSKHFMSKRHLNGLKMLGINENFEIFKDLPNVNQVLELLNSFQEKERENIGFLDNFEQVEDENGNLMSKKVYDQLKKQGIL